MLRNICLTDVAKTWLLDREKKWEMFSRGVFGRPDDRKAGALYDSAATLL